MKNKTRNLTENNLSQEDMNSLNIKKGISEMMEREVVEHERNAPLNMKFAKRPDYKVPDDDYEYLKKGKLIKFGFRNPEIQKHVLTINNNDVINLIVNKWCISLKLEQMDYGKKINYFSDIPNVRQTQDGYVYSQRIIYKDAIRILKRIGYKKDSEYISIVKEDNKISYYSVSEEWYHEKHNTIYEHLLFIVNINQNKD